MKRSYLLSALVLLNNNDAFAFSGCKPIYQNTLKQRGLRSLPSDDSIDFEAITTRLTKELTEFYGCAAIVAEPLFVDDSKIEPDQIVRVCDELDEWKQNNNKNNLFLSNQVELRRLALEFKRYELLAKLMRKDYDAYIATASFLSPSRIPRMKLPNLQDVPFDTQNVVAPVMGDDGQFLVADCTLDDMKYQDSLLDKILLSLFRKLVEENSGGVAVSSKEGMPGLLEQGRTFMLQRTPEAQHKMVRDTLAGLMTPVLPPFYRIFMSGILGDNKQLGPWFYAPILTSIVTPTFFGFLVGPSVPNRRKDGQPGGLVVEKCKFLQESKCKGLCLHQCKLPAQQFFQDNLGLPLTVSPNFETQECQWSFGETPLPPEEDPSFPRGCLVGCESRKAMTATNTVACS